MLSCSVRMEKWTYGRTRTDMANVTATFRSFENVAQNCQYKENQTSVYWQSIVSIRKSKFQYKDKQLSV